MVALVSFREAHKRRSDVVDKVESEAMKSAAS
jgi:hypothetical protein